jgi:peptide/nickel transport system substrate-binding protein
MKWSDGVPFTADDIVFWYEDVILNTDIHPTPPSWMMVGGEVGVVEALDDYTVKFSFSAPYSFFLHNLCVPDGVDPVAFPRHWFEQFHIAYNPDVEAMAAEAGLDSWVYLFIQKGGSTGSVRPGSGGARWQTTGVPTLNPWLTLEPLTDDATRLLLVRNPYFFKVDPEGNQLPYIDYIEVNVGDNIDVLVLLALGGQIDMQNRHIGTPENRAIFESTSEVGEFHFYELVPAIENEVFLNLNLTHPDPVKREIFQNKDFRIGLSYAIDRQTIIDIVFGGVGTPYQIAPPPGALFYNEQLGTQYTEYDVELANEYLDRAGYSERDADGFRLGPDGNRISTTILVNEILVSQINALQLIQGNWEQVGIEMKIEPLDRQTMVDYGTANQHDAMLWLGSAAQGQSVILDPRYYFPFSENSYWGKAWQYWYNNPNHELAEEPPAVIKHQMELYDELLSTSDPDTQNALMNEILQIAADEFYVMGVTLPTSGYGIVKNNFHNVPSIMPSAWLYGNPGPTNIMQYFIEDDVE